MIPDDLVPLHFFHRKQLTPTLSSSCGEKLARVERSSHKRLARVSSPLEPKSWRSASAIASAARRAAAACKLLIYWPGQGTNSELVLKLSIVLLARP